MMYWSIRKEKGGDILLKKRYILVVLGVVSVLLVSLFSLALAGDVTPSGKPQPSNNKDCVEITALDWTSVSRSGFGRGAFLYEGREVELVFIFDPKQDFLNVTGMWMTFVAWSNYPAYPKIFDITLNDGMTITTPEKFYAEGQVSAASLEIDSSVHHEVKEGVNEITLENPRYVYDLGVEVAHMEIFRVTLFVEYEYQAR